MNIAARIIVALLGIVAMAVAMVLWTETAISFLAIIGSAAVGIFWVSWWIGDLA